MIINLTQHQATPDQLQAGVVDVRPELQGRLVAALTFNTLPSREEIQRAANELVAVTREMGADTAMIGGAPFFMAPAEIALRKAGISVVYAFSVRRSVDTVQADGTVRKTAIFQHAGFVPGLLDV